MNGARPSCTKDLEELGNLRGGMESPEREVAEQVESVLQEVNY
jgi:hypothetical protein